MPLNSKLNSVKCCMSKILILKILIFKSLNKWIKCFIPQVFVLLFLGKIGCVLSHWGHKVSQDCHWCPLNKNRWECVCVRTCVCVCVWLTSRRLRSLSLSFSCFCSCVICLCVCSVLSFSTSFICSFSLSTCLWTCRKATTAHKHTHIKDNVCSVMRRHS